MRQELLESAVTYYQGFTKSKRMILHCRPNWPPPHIRLVQVYADQGSTEWIAEFASVVEIVERLVNQGVDVSGWKGLHEGVLFRSAADRRITAIQGQAKRSGGH